ncbi:MAG: CRISPR-associated RAMP protein [Deltaproteobacteria bacterium]|nr:CRISPR-associated RAMP protein [Deltaproteobacteria bacterium]
MPSHDVRFQKLLSRVLIRGRLTLLTALHIGATHAQPVSGETDTAVIKEFGEKPLIPGSSFKGALRATAERIVDSLSSTKVRTCYGAISGPGCYSVSKEIQKAVKDALEKDGVTDEQNEMFVLLEGEQTRLIQEKSCYNCNFFGSPYLGSKVQIKDLQWLAGGAEDLRPLYHIRDGVSIDRDTDTAVEKRKFDFEVVEPGVKFDLEIVVENPTAAELGLLFIALQQFEGRKGENGQRFPGAVALGGHKSRGLGRVDIQIESVEVMDEGGKLLKQAPKEAKLLHFLLTGAGHSLVGEKLSAFKKDMVEDFQTSLTEEG